MCQEAPNSTSHSPSFSSLKALRATSNKSTEVFVANLGLDVLISSITTHMIHTMVKSQCCALYQEAIQVKIKYWSSLARRDKAKRLGCKNLG
jgi:hypothetical protein